MSINKEALERINAAPSLIRDEMLFIAAKFRELDRKYLELKNQATIVVTSYGDSELPKSVDRLRELIKE